MMPLNNIRGVPRLPNMKSRCVGSLQETKIDPGQNEGFARWAAYLPSDHNESAWSYMRLRSVQDLAVINLLQLNAGFLVVQSLNRTSESVHITILARGISRRAVGYGATT
jgi:hypothetical protein